MSNDSYSISIATLLHSNNVNSSDLVNLGMKCGASAHSLRASAQNIVSRKNNESNRHYLSQIKQLLSSLTDLWTGPVGIELAALPMMRKHISLQYLSSNVSPIPFEYQSRVCPLSIQGANNNRIDGLLITHSSLPISTTQNLQSICSGSTTTTSPASVETPTVLFCPPNAGFYECLVMAQSNSSWLGFYLSRGLR